MSVAIDIWRIAPDTPDYEAHDISGKGAEETGSRWNRKGTPVVYASTSRSLACLETVVHLSAGTALPLNRFLVKIQIPSASWNARVVFKPASHIGWDAEPAGRVSLDWGTTWALGKSTLVAEIPSIIVPEEPNFLINPAHADVHKLKAIKVRKWTYDFRLK